MVHRGQQRQKIRCQQIWVAQEVLSVCAACVMPIVLAPFLCQGCAHFRAANVPLCFARLCVLALAGHQSRFEIGYVIDV
jgi:hypothetical protein